MDADVNDPTPTSRTVADLPGTPAEVWEVVSSPEGVESWLGEGSSLPPVEGAHLDVADTETGTRRHGSVETVEPGRRLGYVWWPADDPRRDGGDAAATRVEIQLVPHGPGTRLIVTETPVGTTSGTGGTAWAWRMASVELMIARRALGAGLVLSC